MNKKFVEAFFQQLCMDFYDPNTGSINKLDKFYAKEVLVELGEFRLNYGRLKNRVQNLHQTYESARFNVKNMIVFGNSFIIDFTCALTPKNADKSSIVRTLVVYFTLKRDKIIYEKVLSEENFYFDIEQPVVTDQPESADLSN